MPTVVTGGIIVGLVGVEDSGGAGRVRGGDRGFEAAAVTDRFHEGEKGDQEGKREEGLKLSIEDLYIGEWMMDTKKWYHSKLMLEGIAAIVIGGYATILQAAQAGTASFLGITMVVFGVCTEIFRYVTTKPIGPGN